MKNKVPIFIGTGNSAGGKSTLLRYAKQAFQNHGLFEPMELRDRDLLSRAVFEDGKQGTQLVTVNNELAHRSAHALLYKDHVTEGLRKFTVRDGVLLNRVHREMRDFIAHFEDPRGLLVEWTIGPNIPAAEFPEPTGEEDLIQDAESVVRLFNEYGEKHIGQENTQIMTMAINAEFKWRIMRNKRRPDAMQEDDFRRIFHDGGELTDAFIDQFPDNVLLFTYDNNYDGEEHFFGEMARICKNRIPELMEGRPYHEGPFPQLRL